MIEHSLGTLDEWASKLFKLSICIVSLFFNFQIVGLEKYNLKSILNFFPITETVGTAGQPTKAQFSDIKNANFSVVVNLNMPNSENALQEEEIIVSSLGMRYFHIPVPWDAPSVSHVKQFFEVMDTTEAVGDKVFVHCAANYRVSAFMYKYLTLRKNISPTEATSPVLKNWLPKMNEEWKSVIELTADQID